MTLSTTLNRISYTAGAADVTFPYTFKILATTDLDVYVDEVLQTSGYTVTGAGDPTGGNVVFAVAPGVSTVLIVRNTPLTQSTDYTEGDAFPAASHEDALDKLTMMMQDLEYRVAAVEALGAVAGTHTGADNAAVLTDSTKTWTVNQWIGFTIKNLTDGSECVVTSNTANTITGTLTGGTGNDWDLGDTYVVIRGIGVTGVVKLDDLATPDDNTDLNASASRHGLLKKLSGTVTEFLSGAGTFIVPTYPNVGEGHITLFPFGYSALIAGTWGWGVAATQACAGWFYNSTHADLDQFDFKAYLAPGTYTVSIFGKTDVDAGIIEVLIDGVSKGTVDIYSNPIVLNTIKTVAAISVTTAGLKTISLKVNGKNAGSSKHYLYATIISIYRTA